jgi:hypothetical protein
MQMVHRAIRARYLSQQFVEDLCSSSGLSDRLLDEIERVIFEAHPIENREGAIDFAERLADHTERHRLARQREAQAVALQLTASRIASTN